MAAVTSFVPYLHVSDIDRSIRFYQRLGFWVDTSQAEPDGRIIWAAMRCSESWLMLAPADEPVDRAVQGVMFYAYAADVETTRKELIADGVGVSKVRHPHYMPAGEIRIEDPDGYVVLIGQLA